MIEKELRTAVEKEQLDKFTAAAKDQVSKWETAAKTDPEIGGDKFDANIVAAKSVLGKFGNEAFTKYLNETGLGSHPEMIRMMIKIAKEFGEDKLLAGGAGAGQAQAKSTAEVLYPNQAAPRK